MFVAVVAELIIPLVLVCLSATFPFGRLGGCTYTTLQRNAKTGTWRNETVGTVLVSLSLSQGKREVVLAFPAECVLVCVGVCVLVVRVSMYLYECMSECVSVGA